MLASQHSSEKLGMLCTSFVRSMAPGDLIDGDDSESEDSPTFNAEGAAALEAASRNWGCLE